MHSLHCPDCSAPLDHFQAVVATPRLIPAVLVHDGQTILLREEPKAAHVPLPAPVDVVTCSRCEFGATVADVLAGKL